MLPLDYTIIPKGFIFAPRHAKVNPLYNNDTILDGGHSAQKTK